jgi:DNA repair exonuclease SbcCD nuclease subunit
VVRPNLKYLALGHFHGVTHIEGAHPTVMYYSGAPEAHGFNHSGMRHFLEVEIEDENVQVKPVPSARIVYETYPLDCGEFEHAQQLVEAMRLRASGQPVPQIARVTLTGQCLPSLLSELPAVYDAAAPQFESLQLIDQTVPAEDYEELARETTTLGAFVEHINGEIADAPDDARAGVLKRAREVGVAAYREQKFAIRGIDFGGASV